MKRPIGFLFLIALSLGSSVAQLWSQSKKQPTLEEDVKNSLFQLYEWINAHPILESFPEWLGASVVESGKHYQDYGVLFFHCKTWIYFLTIVAVLLLFFDKKIGFSLYVLAQIGTVAVLFVAFGLTGAALIAALFTALISLLFIKLYLKYVMPHITSKS